MKRLLLILLIATALSARGQNVADTVQTKTVFAELLGWNTNVLGLGSKSKVEVDFGEENWGWQGNDGRNILVDENGKDIKFNSMVDAMNFMGERGWVFEAAYVVTVANQNVVHWLMSKTIGAGEDARQGVNQKRDFKKKKKKKESPAYNDPIYGN